MCESLSNPAHLVNWKRSTTVLHLKAKVLLPHAQTTNDDNNIGSYVHECDQFSQIRSRFSTIKQWDLIFIPKSMVSMGKSSVLIPWQQTKSSIWVKNSKAALANKPETCRWTQPCILQHRPQLLFTRDNNSSTNGLNAFLFAVWFVNCLLLCTENWWTFGNRQI